MKIVGMHFLYLYVITATLILFTAADSVLQNFDCPRGWMIEEFEIGVRSCIPKSIVVEPLYAHDDPCPPGTYTLYKGSCSKFPSPPVMQPDGTWIWDWINGTEVSSRTPPCPKDWYVNPNGFCEHRYGYPSLIRGPCPEKSQADSYGKCRQYLQ